MFFKKSVLNGHEVSLQGFPKEHWHGVWTEPAHQGGHPGVPTLSQPGGRRLLCRGQMVNILGFASHVVSVTATQLMLFCLFSTGCLLNHFLFSTKYHLGKFYSLKALQSVLALYVDRGKVLKTKTFCYPIGRLKNFPIIFYKT